MPDSLINAPVRVRVVSLSAGVVSVFARSQQFTLHRGWSFDIQEPAATGAEQLLGLIAADVIDVFLRLAQRARMGIDEVEATVRAVLVDPLVYLGVIGAEGVPRYDHIQFQAYIGSPASAAELTALWDEAVRRAPLVNTLRRGTLLDITMQLAS
jgi:hypothetical protein